MLWNHFWILKKVKYERSSLFSKVINDTRVSLEAPWGVLCEVEQWLFGVDNTSKTFLGLSKILSKSTMVWSHHKSIRFITETKDKGNLSLCFLAHISELVQLCKWFEVTQSTLTLLLLPDLSPRLGFYGTVQEIYEKIWDLNLDNQERSTPPRPRTWTLSGLSLNYSQPQLIICSLTSTAASHRRRGIGAVTSVLGMLSEA